jgi:hypothetical protein
MGLIAGAIGILVIVIGVASFFLDRAGHQQPFKIDPYPSAEEWGSRVRSSTSSSDLFRVPGVSAEDVVSYYQQKMYDFYGMDADPAFRDCKRTPTANNYPAYDRGEPGAAPYQFSCLFDDSGFFITRYTLIVIQPGVEENEGATIIEHQYTWQQ